MKNALLLTTLILVLTSCKKEVTQPTGGIYEGKFSEINLSGDTLASGMLFIALLENDSRYVVKKDSLSPIPPSHLGDYAIVDAQNIQFTVDTGVDSSTNLNYYLNGVYTYTFDDINFTMQRSDTIRTYYYSLQRY